MSVVYARLPELLEAAAEEKGQMAEARAALAATLAEEEEAVAAASGCTREALKQARADADALANAASTIAALL